LRLFATRYGELGVEAAGGKRPLLAALTERIAAGAGALEALDALAPRA
ncbi:MAG: hypothetical protein FJ104_13500, partial [Deltaproteobacteria bacterium]|nr:hypothetical protein [Deltaproteobacteria bacterium]